MLNKLGITSEEPTQSQPPGARSQQWYIRVGPKQDGYYKSVIAQVNAGSYVPPRIRYLHELQLNLKDEVDHYVIDDSSSSSSSESEDDESDEEDNSNDKVPPVVPQDIREIDKSMKQVGSVQDANPYSNLTDQQIKYLIGKLVSTQQTREAATSSTAATVTPNTRTDPLLNQNQTLHLHILKEKQITELYPYQYTRVLVHLIDINIKIRTLKV